ncbi:hypothetical protein MNBD_ALPHA08-573 [hydrothermal vent metagenome]|uniref:Acyltransferase 3 domain-containing protein n=1 Tax=hydrothermal vent metagenome TaxID=652676 RepID=A0A3B0SPG7_9ZZZZ
MANAAVDIGPKKPRQVMHSLQVLRAIAALLVVFSHIREKNLQNAADSTQILQWFNFGPYGVDIFFVISGFIIAYIMPVGQYSLGDVKEFLARRVIRVMPMYWVVTLAAFSVWLYNPEMVNSSAPELTRVWQSFTLYPTDGRYLYQTGWTLSYEMYFYFLFAATMLFGRFQRLLLALILTTMITIGIVYQPGPEDPLFYLLTRHHLLEFMAGFAFCHFGKHLIGKMPITGAVLSVTGVALILAKAFDAGPIFDLFYFWGLPAMALVFGMLLLERAIPWPAYWVKLGEASYSLYLTHSFVMAAGAIIWYRLFDGTMASNIGFMFVSLAVSLVVAHLAYRFIENAMTVSLNKKWKELKNRPQKQQVAPAE